MLESFIVENFYIIFLITFMLIKKNFRIHGFIILVNTIITYPEPSKMFICIIAIMAIISDVFNTYSKKDVKQPTESHDNQRIDPDYTNSD